MDDTQHDDENLRALYSQYAILIEPVITQTGDSRWRAQYPGLDWSVVVDTEETAGQELAHEALRRHDTGQPDAQPPHDLLARHLEQPIAGVFAMDLELFVYLRDNAGRRETERAFAEAERRRAAGRSYTKSDYLHDQG